MGNISKKINKLLYALKQKGEIYKINSFQYYNKKKNKYSTKYQIYKKNNPPVINRTYEEEKEKYNFIDSYYSKIDILKYLIEEYQKGSEANE